MIGAGSSFHIAIAVSSHFIQVCLVCISEKVDYTVEVIRYWGLRTPQLKSLIFNLDICTLHLRIIYKTLEVRVCKVKSYSAPENR